MRLTVNLKSLAANGTSVAEVVDLALLSLVIVSK